jgi:hypothetical protein
MRRFAPLIALSLVGCLDFSIGGKGDAGTVDGSATKTDATTTADASTTTGISCGQDPQTGETLCLGLSTCPGLTVDQNEFPGCGFRVTGGSTVDLECACSGYVCPIGIATSCAQAKSLLASQTFAGVCVQVSEGRCTSGNAKAPPNNCDKTCASQCGGDPTCLQGCGC